MPLPLRAECLLRLIWACLPNKILILTDGRTILSVIQCHSSFQSASTSTREDTRPAKPVASKKETIVIEKRRDNNYSATNSIVHQQQSAVRPPQFYFGQQPSSSAGINGGDDKRWENKLIRDSLHSPINWWNII